MTFQAQRMDLTKSVRDFPQPEKPHTSPALTTEAAFAHRSKSLKLPAAFSADARNTHYVQHNVHQWKQLNSAIGVH